MKLTTILLITAAIVTIILTLLPTIMTSSHSESHWGAARPKMTPIESAINVYRQHTGQLPNKLEDLVKCPAGLESVWQGPYLKMSQLSDVRDKPYKYDPNGKTNTNGYVIISYGADGKPGGDGYNSDIVND